MPVHDFDPPDRFVAGTVGPPGQRTFFLQATGGRRVVSVSCEKEQVSVLADRVNNLLDQFAADEAADAGSLPEDTAPLSTPIEDEFRVATLSLAWDPARSVVVVEAFDADLSQSADPDLEVGDESEQAQGRAAADEPASPPAAVRVVLAPAAARAFARRAGALVSAGRPPCPFCGGPLDPTGHVCPRANGYKR